MPQDRHRTRAEALFAAHASGARFAPFRGADAIADLDDAYAVQHALVELLQRARGAPCAGWKIGLTSLRMQALLGIDTPIAGVVLADRVHASGHRVTRGAYARLGLECEIAVRLAHALPARAAPFDFDTVAAAVGAVCAAIELVDDRHADYGLTDVGSLVADNCWNAGLVLGEFSEHWPDLAAAAGTVWRDGIALDRGCGADVLGHPFVPVQWLANHLAQHGCDLPAGMLISTGSLVPTRFPDAPEQCRFVVEGVGEVTLGID